MLFGGRRRAIARRLVCWWRSHGRIIAAAAVASAVIVWLGSDAGLLTRWSSIGTIAFAAASPSLSNAQRSLPGARQWLNTQALQAEDLRDKVVLVNFWTYSRINSLGALPYVRAWAEKYKDRGPLVIGVHAPEFAFEKDVANVRQATASPGVGYPVAIDSDRGIWRAFNNEAWPAFYFIGADGRVRHQVLGEGGYDQSERLIQTPLEEAAGTHVTRDIVAVGGEGP
jgi:thiol-disulfide isomerase/thioredoxin